MKTNEHNEYASYGKKVWVIYIFAVICLIIILVTLVARDNEEKLFYSLMTVVAAYVFRPSDRLIGKAVMRLFGVAPPAESNDSE